MLKVCSRQCDQCLFSKNKIVSDKRKKDILKGCITEDTHFICHKASMAGDEAVCRGFFDGPGSQGHGQMIRIAGRLNAIEFVKPEDFQTN